MLVESTFVEAPEDVLSEVGLGVLFAETETVTHGYVLPPAEAQEIARLLNETEGVNFISAPRVTLVDGRQARISDLGPNRGVRGRRSVMAALPAAVTARISQSGMSNRVPASPSSRIRGILESSTERRKIGTG